MSATAYTTSFFAQNAVTSVRSADVVVPYLCDLLQPESVVDVGCGVGGWLAVFAARGVRDVLGVDGGYVRAEQLRIPRESFRAHDLGAPLELGRRFDLALSMEVAEHLSPGRADSFVRDLTSLAPVIVFSAAIPGQTGPGHVNEQWPEYWVERFAARGFRVHDVLRPVFWHDARVAYWYAQNMLVFTGPDAPPERVRRIEAAGAAAPAAYARVHPGAWLRATDPRCADLAHTLRSFPHAVRTALAVRFGFLRSKGGTTGAGVA